VQVRHGLVRLPIETLRNLAEQGKQKKEAVEEAALADIRNKHHV
jgi:hypothetical protein